MFAMQLDKAKRPLELHASLTPEPGPTEVRLKVRACGVCRTDVHLCDGDLPLKGAPRVPGHEVVGVVEAIGHDVLGVHIGDRVGVPWMHRTCGRCRFCLAGETNLCDSPTFTGWTLDGGYAERMIADADSLLPIPGSFSDAEAAPLLCAGLIGYRAWRMGCNAAGGVWKIGLYGFGAAAHLLAQLAQYSNQDVYAFTRPGDTKGMKFARALGSVWAGGSDEKAPVLLDVAIIFASDGSLVPVALKAVRKGGAVVCAGIHMSDIPSFPYDLLWGERKLMSVANLQRRDGLEYLPLAAKAGVKPHVVVYPLDKANEALDALRSGTLIGAAVLEP